MHLAVPLAVIAILRAIVAADDEFREQLPPDWDRDPLADEIDRARAFLAEIDAPPASQPEEPSR